MGFTVQFIQTQNTCRPKPYCTFPLCLKSKFSDTRFEVTSKHFLTSLRHVCTQIQAYYKKTNANGQKLQKKSWKKQGGHNFNASASISVENGSCDG